MNESNSSLSQAQGYLSDTGLDGWLLYDYQGSNPILWRLLGENVPNVTRPLWLYVPAEGPVALLVHEVDVGRFPYGLAEIHSFAGRDSMIDGLRDRIGASTRLAMEYSPLGTLPRVGRVDAGTIELVRSLGIDVISSGDAIQYATERWMPHQLESHRYAASKLHEIVHGTVAFVRENVRWKLTEHDVAEHIRGQYAMLGLETRDGPVVAFDAHSSDPHYEPAPGDSSVIRRRGWLLIDLWARKQTSSENRDSVYADITWNIAVGDASTERETKVFELVRDARDAAVEFLSQAVQMGRRPRGWEVDQVARTVVNKAGYGKFFVHRLGHSLGREVHSNGVNLDNWETHDTRSVIDGIGITIEPGVYLPDFGVRSEINVFMGPDGPEITSPPQKEVLTTGG